MDSLPSDSLSSSDGSTQSPALEKAPGPATSICESPDIHSSSDDYYSRFSSRAGQWFLEVQRQALRDLLHNKGIVSVLDVGGGHGQIAPALVEMGCEVTVQGSAPECGRRLTTLFESGKASFTVSPLHHLPFPDRSFDLVVSIRQLSHLEQWRPFILELCRVSRQAVVLDYPIVQSLNYLAPALFSLKRAVEKNTRTFTVFRQPEVEEAFAEARFVHTRSIGQFVLPMALHRALNMPQISKAVEGGLLRCGLERFASPKLALFEARSTRI